MAEVVNELGVKSPKKLRNAKSHIINKNTASVNTVNISKKDIDKQLEYRSGQLVDFEISKNNITPKSKSNYQNEVESKNITRDGALSNHSPHRSKGNHECKKENLKYNKEFVNGFDKICPNNVSPAEKSREHSKKVKIKKGKYNLNGDIKENGDVSALEQSFQDLIVDSSSQMNGDDNAANCHHDGKEGRMSSKKSPNSKEAKKETDKSFRKDLQHARHKFWLSYFEKNPTNLLLLAFHKMNELHKVDFKQQLAQFKCGVCQYYCNSMNIVLKHIKEERHNNNIKKLWDNYTVKVLPKLPASHTDVITDLVESLYKQYRMTGNDFIIRQSVVKYIDELVQKELPGCSARMFGSSVHCLGLKSCDLNIDLHVGENWVPSNALCLVADVIRKYSAFRRVKNNFNEKIPNVAFTHGESKVSCVISLNNERPVLLAALIAKYARLHPVLQKLTTVFRLWGKMVQVDRQDRGFWPSYALYLLVIFFLQHCDEPVLPVLNEFVTDNPSESDSNEYVLKLDIDEVKSQWQSNNTQTVGELWVNLFKFYASNCDYPNFVVSIDNSEPKFRQPKRINVVDPFMPKRNVTRTVSCTSSYNYISNCLKTSYKYFGIPQTVEGPIFGNIVEELVAPEKYQHCKDVFLLCNSTTSQLIRLIPYVDKNYLLNITEGEAYTKVARVLNSRHPNYLNLSNVNIKLMQRDYPANDQYKNLIVSPQDAHYLIHQLDPTVLKYRFTKVALTGNMAAPLVCDVCKEEGHIKDECPAEELPPLEILPPVDKKMLFYLDALCSEVYDKWIPDTRELQKRDEIVNLLQNYISSIYPTAVLTLFGSSKNGFGSRRSDLDICLTFKEEDARKDLKPPEFIEKLGVQLKLCPGLKNLLIISSAKVPIIKFEHTESKLEGDISLYNILGQENTQLLHSYTEIDDRVTPLGFMMKKLAKHCHIGDASKGGLSSYAYSLMAIYFLQHCSPPVLPVLQELHEGDGPCPEVIIDGCNTYYYKDIHKLNKVWKNRQENTCSVGNLWLQLLRFYTETFDIEKHVISIRTSKIVTKFEKLWISKCIAIEDPFDVAHNLGSALSRNMNIFIITQFRKGRKIFGSSIQSSPNHSSFQALYFNTVEFQVTSPPNDRGCRLCKKIGHVVRDCPTKQAVSDKKIILKQNKKNKENTAIAAASEDSKESGVSLATSDSDSAESTEDKMSFSKISRKSDSDDSPGEQISYLKFKSNSSKVGGFQVPVNNPPVKGPSHLKFTSVKGDSKNQEDHFHTGSHTDVPLVRSPKPSTSSGDKIQDKYCEDMMYSVPYPNVVQSRDTQHCTEGEEGIPQTLVYTNSNFKHNMYKEDFLPPTHTASIQIPTSMVYTNTNYRNGRHITPAERSGMIQTFPEVCQPQRFTQVPGSVGNPSSGCNSNKLHNVGFIPCSPPISIGFVHTVPLNTPRMPPVPLSPPISGSDPRVGHPLVHHMNNPLPSVSHVRFMQPTVFEFNKVYDNAYSYNVIQDPRASSTVTGRNFHNAEGPHNSAQHYEEPQHTGLNNSVPPGIVDLVSNNVTPFSAFKMPNQVSAIGQTGRNKNKNRSRAEYGCNELEQLDRRATLLTSNREPNTTDFADTSSARQGQRGKKCSKRGRGISRKLIGREDQNECKNTDPETVTSTKSSSSDSQIV